MPSLSLRFEFRLQAIQQDLIQLTVNPYRAIRIGIEIGSQQEVWSGANGALLYVCVTQNDFSYSNFQPENNLRTKPPQYRAKRTQETQEKARKQTTTTYREKSAGCRFKSCPAHHFFDETLGLFRTLTERNCAVTPSQCSTRSCRVTAD